MAKYIIGVDGGGSKTLGLLANERGQILASNGAGPSNYQVLGLEKAIENINKTISPLLVEITGEKTKVYIILGSAGIGRSQDKERMKRALTKKLRRDTELVVTSDAYIALIGALGGAYGVAVNAGTGAIAMGLNKDGQFARADGWGYILGDEGGGYWIGLEAIKAALQAYDGRGEDTLLQEIIKEYFSIKELPELVEETYQKRSFPDQVAKLAPFVFKAASAGDKISNELLAQAGYKLGVSARSVIQRLKMENEKFELSLIGGVFQNEPLNPLLQSFKKVIAQGSPQCQIIQPKFSPEIGAVLLGLYQCYRRIPKRILENLKNYRGDHLKVDNGNF